MARKKKRQSQQRISKKQLLDLFHKYTSPLALRDIYKTLKPSEAEKQSIRNMLGQLEENGKLINIGGKAYGLVEKMDLLRGSLEIQRSGVGFVRPQDRRRKDIFIPPHNIGEAWNGDEVLVALIPGGKKEGKNPEGRIVRILQRRLKRIPVRINKELAQGMRFAQPVDPKFSQDFLLEDDKSSSGLDPGVVVVAEPVERLDKHLWKGKCREILGPEEETDVQETVVKILNQIPRSFPKKVLAEAEALPSDPVREDVEARHDLRDLLFVTIDGASAKDFDDAVYVEKTRQGYTLYVAIADVSHYVEPGTPMDQEARNRSNSFYFPNSVEPMFPQALSTGLCSLNPDADRLVMTVKMHFSREGEVLSRDFFSAVIRSKARLTYSRVKQALLDNDREEQEGMGPVYPMLRSAEGLAGILNANRISRGSLNFDLPEPEIHFNPQQEAVDIQPKARHFGHQIVEEFMIAANEAVAGFLDQKKLPLLYRIHPEPNQDKLEALFKLLRKTSLAEHVPEDTDAQSLQRLLEQVEGTRHEFLVNRLLLRSMMQASYYPQNQGHFGLASPCYSHFTSPIRRYADLVLHRILKRVLQETEHTTPGRKKLYKLADHLSQQERIGMAAEREILKRLTIIFLQDKLEETFTGVVNSVTDFGFWVELKEVMADGLVRLSSITDDYYIYWAKEHCLIGRHTGRMFSMGQEVKVRLSNVSLSRQEIDLELEESEEE
ncbi:MAG: ribonuclease R [Desulfohalobiaceae bacterium]|nr:ribonuclease R [Desulfohalobiaceae bacterium]